ncbi:hypothetical protein TsFJ059_000274 [Trichoderma semiorbis]|uniref:Uncharacterized protein n=1 Tax=Trichoderma semiorbis TaxID=1491008 RepID=A0A9P8HLM5_9HYPO|nr:hypothetical protein TsFJ059_000274 [Trichoderma semiorbis]
MNDRITLTSPSTLPRSSTFEAPALPNQQHVRCESSPKAVMDVFPCRAAITSSGSIRIAPSLSRRPCVTISSRIPKKHLRRLMQRAEQHGDERISRPWRKTALTMRYQSPFR